jgi:hypothetical protein
MSKNLSEIFPPTEIGGGGGGGIEEAPKTGKMYARKDATWEEFATGNLDDGNQDGEILTWDTAAANWTHDDTMIVKGGRVGIGTDNPQRNLTIGGSADATTNLQLTNATTGTGGSDGFLIRQYTNGNVILYNAEPANLMLHTDATERMRIDSSGRVGIGTDSPATPLHVNGLTENSAYATFGTLNRRQLVLSSFFVGTRNDAGHDFNASGVDGTLTFSTVNTERMRIDSSGNVGIGYKTPSALGLLAVGDGSTGTKTIAINGSGSSTSVMDIDFRGGGTGGPAGRVRFKSSTKDLSFWTGDYASIAQRMTITDSGNVGIGTDSPESKLHLSEDSAPIYIRQTRGTTNPVVQTSGPNGSDPTSSGQIGTSSNHGFRIITNGQQQVLVDTSGRVGIGGTPSRSTKEIEDEAEATLRNWDSKDKKPTKAELIKKLTERTIGGGTAKLQVAGDGYFSGDVITKNIYRAEFQCCGIRFSGNNSGGHIIPIDSAGDLVDGLVNLGLSGWRFKDAHFSGTVNANYLTSTVWNSGQSGRPGLSFGNNNDVLPTDSAGSANDGVVNLGRGGPQIYRFKDAYFSGTIYGKVDDVADHIKAITPTQIANWDAGTGGGGGATTDGRISDTDITNWNKAWDWGNHADAGYQPAGNYLTPSSLNGYATESWVSTNYQPAGNYLTAIVAGNGTKVTGTKIEMSGSYNGTFTATGDIVAYSDVRLKEKIRTLDGSKVFDMRGVSFERDGKPSSGVIAQELREIAPELVHDDGEHLGVAYGNLVGYLIEAVKELKAEVEALKRG